MLCAVAVCVGGGTYPAASMAAQLPRMYSTPVLHGETSSNVVSVRPRFIVTDSADGGQLNIHWTQWTNAAAAGYGVAHPDHGSYAIRVRAGDVIAGEFTRVTVTATSRGANHRPDHLMLATLEGVGLYWVQVEWVDNPESGFSPWTG